MSVIIDTKRIPYDTLMPDKNITEFISFCREVKSRYEGNARETSNKEEELQDLMHYVELHGDLDCKGGYALYKKIRETRRERRKCKSENELLLPVYNWIAANDTALNRLAEALGNVRKAAELIDNKKYIARTDVLEE